MPDSLDPFRSAIDAVLDEDLREELHKAEAQFRQELPDTLAAKGRATDLIRNGRLDRPFERMEAKWSVSQMTSWLS